MIWNRHQDFPPSGSPRRIIAIDADDTLWDCQSHFDLVENRLYELISPWSDQPKRELYKTESANMADLGYGCKAFTLSVIETAMRVSHNQIDTASIQELLDMGKALLHLPATPLPGVRETLATLRERLKDDQASDVKMICFTKGELQDQENKLRRSGLLKYFDGVKITSDKTQKEFNDLCEQYQTHPSQLLMVGNSLKSDIAPALAIGAWAIHIPFHVTWQLEESEDFEHPRMIKIEHFSQLLDIL